MKIKSKYQLAAGVAAIFFCALAVELTTSFYAADMTQTGKNLSHISAGHLVFSLFLICLSAFAGGALFIVLSSTDAIAQLIKYATDIADGQTASPQPVLRKNPWKTLAQRISRIDTALVNLQQAERRLRTELLPVFDNINVGIILTDHQGCIKRMNHLAATLSGWGKKEAVDRDLSDVFVIQDMQSGQYLPSPIMRAMEEKHFEENNKTTLFIARDTMTFNITYSCTRIDLDLDGEPNHEYIVIFEDITDRCALSTSLEENKTRYNEIINKLPVSFFICDLQGHIIDVNDTAESMFGYTRTELLATSFGELLSSDIPYDAAHVAALFKACKNDSVLEMEWLAKTKTGETLWTMLQLYKSQLAGSDVITVTMNDISKRKQAITAMESRIVALTRPLSADAPLHIDDLFNTKDLQKIQDHFSEAVHAASSISDCNGTPITEASNFTPFCKLIRSSEQGRARCVSSNAQITTCTAARCSSGGLWHACAPITVGGRLIANWRIGQVRDESCSDERVISFAEEIGVDPDELLKAFHEVPCMSRSQFQMVVEALEAFTNQLSTIAYQNVQQARFIAERRRAEDDLRTTLNSIGDAVIVTDSAGCITTMNPVAEQLTGWLKREALGQSITKVMNMVDPVTRAPRPCPAPCGQAVMHQEHSEQEAARCLLLSRDGSEYCIADSASLIQARPTSPVLGVVIVFRDITAEDALQKRLQQSRKMEALGQLAGGIAHDFNNMLGGILSSVDILQKHVHSEQGRKFLGLIDDAATEAADLTSKMLVFSRSSPVDFTPTDLNQVIVDTVEIARHGISKDIELHTELLTDQHTINGNASLLQTLFLNLCINASQAIGRAGHIQIRTQLVELEDAFCKNSPFDLIPGKYIVCEVHDDGMGIESKYMDHLFEPFFSTKKMGKGAGLGLSTVYGIIKQHHGMITAFSVPSEGSVFKTYFPLISSVAVAPPMPSEYATYDDCTILVIDDDKIIRATNEAILEDMGYHVLLADSGESGVKVFEQNHRQLDAVVLDMIMPGMTGRDCFEQMAKIDPDVPVILSSGFTSDINIRAMQDQGLFETIVKPCPSKRLGEIIARAVTARRSHSLT